MMKRALSILLLCFTYSMVQSQVYKLDTANVIARANLNFYDFNDRYQDVEYIIALLRFKTKVAFLKSSGFDTNRFAFFKIIRSKHVDTAGEYRKGNTIATPISYWENDGKEFVFSVDKATGELFRIMGFEKDDRREFIQQQLNMGTFYQLPNQKNTAKNRRRLSTMISIEGVDSKRLLDL